MVVPYHPVDPKEQIACSYGVLEDQLCPTPKRKLLYSLCFIFRRVRLDKHLSSQVLCAFTVCVALREDYFVLEKYANF